MFNNEKGSVLSVALIVITLLTFSLTTVSAYTFRVAENTNRVIERNDQENEGRFLISQSIEYFKIETRNFSQDIFENFEENFEDANIIEEIKEKYGVVVTDAGKITSGGSEDEYIARAYDFAYTLASGRTLVKTLYATYGGQEFEEYRTYLFSMATNANLVLNGGEFDEANIYARWIELNWKTIDQKDGNYSILDATVANYPYFNESRIISENYGACLETADCITEDSTGRFIFDFNVENADRNDLGFPLFDDIFRGFNFEDHLSDSIFEMYGYEDYANVNSISKGDMEGTTSLTTDRRVNDNLNMNWGTLNTNGNLLIVEGDLYIDSMTQILGDGIILVLGDLYIHNDSNVNISSTFMVEGRTHIDFDAGYGIDTTDNFGFALFTRENLIIDNLHAVHTNNVRPRYFMMAGESVLINATRQDMNFRGAIYAMALSEGDDKKGLSNSDLHPDFMIQRGGLLRPIHGLLLNSFSGTFEEGDPDDEETNDTWNPADPEDSGEWDWSPGEGQPPWSGGGGGANPGGGGPPSWTQPGRARGGTHMYSQQGLYETESTDVKNEFVAMPQFDTLLLYVGDISFETGTFRYE